MIFSGCVGCAENAMTVNDSLEGIYIFEKKDDKATEYVSAIVFFNDGHCALYQQDNYIGTFDYSYSSAMDIVAVNYSYLRTYGVLQVSDNSIINCKIGIFKKTNSLVESSHNAAVATEPTNAIATQPTTGKTNEETSKQETKATIVYSIKEMTAEEIFDECRYYYQIFSQVSTKDSIKPEDFKALFKVTPESMTTTTATFGYTDTYTYTFNEKTLVDDTICRIRVDSIEQMDGSLILSPHFEMSFNLTDYDKAVSVYELLQTYIWTELGENRYCSDNRHGLTWETNALDKEHTPFTPIYMNKNGSRYEFIFRNSHQYLR